jgi:L-lactate dehydrogenase complex protein LldG
MQDSSGNREQMLGRIREALGRAAHATSAPEPLPPFNPFDARPDAGGLVERFASELAKVGAGAAQADTAAGVREHLEGLLAASVDEPVAVSDGETLRRLGLREWLVQSGRRVVPTLKEFVAEGLRPAAGRTDPARGEEEEVAALVEQYRALLLDAAVGITTADYALADTGTLVILSGEEQHRLISLLPPAHVCLLDPARVLPSLTHLLERLRGRFGAPRSAPKNMTCITGPSRTADIEQAITMGVHGPKSLNVILYSPEN